jgi:hypothetical protein
MAYRLDEILTLSDELGFTSKRIDDNRVEVEFDSDGTLVFLNMPEENDTLIGFDGTPWHGHDKLMLMTDEATYIELDELDILLAIKSGEVVILSRYVSGELTDRWLAHKDEKVDLKYIEPNEEMRVKRRA